MEIASTRKFNRDSESRTIAAESIPYHQITTLIRQWMMLFTIPALEIVFYTPDYFLIGQGYTHGTFPDSAGFSGRTMSMFNRIDYQLIDHKSQIMGFSAVDFNPRLFACSSSLFNRLMMVERLFLTR